MSFLSPETHTRDYRVAYVRTDRFRIAPRFGAIPKRLTQCARFSKMGKILSQDAGISRTYSPLWPSLRSARRRERLTLLSTRFVSPLTGHTKAACIVESRSSLCAGPRRVGLCARGLIHRLPVSMIHAPPASGVTMAKRRTTATTIFMMIMRHYPVLVRANAANVEGAAIDQIIFPLIAFGTIFPTFAALQFVANVAGGALWS
jgi:hypothetical protein